MEKLIKDRIAKYKSDIKKFESEMSKSSNWAKFDYYFLKIEKLKKQISELRWVLKIMASNAS